MAGESFILEFITSNHVTLEILPEKKGYIKRHIEYQIHSSKFKSQVLFVKYTFILSYTFFLVQVVRRYSDFYAFYEVFAWRFPNRNLPPIPPQKLSALVKGTDSNFAEERRKGLLRWLKIILVHPILCGDPATEVKHFILYF